MVTMTVGAIQIGIGSGLMDSFSKDKKPRKPMRKERYKIRPLLDCPPV